MTNQTALQALEELRKERQVSSNISPPKDYNLDKPNNVVGKLLEQIQIQASTQTSSPTQTSASSSREKSLLEYVGEGVFSGVYEYGQQGLFGTPGLVEAGLEKAFDTEIGFQDYMRKGQEDNALAKVLGGVGGAVGFMQGLPVKLTSKILGQAVVRPAAYLLGKKSLKTATNQASKIAKQSGLDKKIVTQFNTTLKNTSRASVGKAKLADKLFESSFNNEINQFIARGIRSGTLNKQQEIVIRNMAAAVRSKGVPVQTLHALSMTKYGNTAMGRFMSEGLHDAFIFSIADGVMESVLMGEEMLEGDLDKFDVGRLGWAMGTGFLMGTAVNAATAGFKDLGKMNLSRTDFKRGIKSYLGTNNYKGKDLTYLSGQMVEFARTNKKNSRPTKIDFMKDGKKEYIDLNPFGSGNRDLSQRAIERRLRASFGDDAEAESIKWLMSTKRQYGKDLIKYATKEGFENYKKLFPRMLVAGAAMGGTQSIMTSVQGGEIQYEDLISSMLIGAWTMRRGAGQQSTRVDFGTEINQIRQSLESLGIRVENTFYSSSMSEPNERFGVGLARENVELSNYLKEQRIVSDDDATITSEELGADEKTFLDTSSGIAVDPHDGKMNILHQIMSEDFRHSKTLDQISDKQANEIIKILDTQGFKKPEDFHRAFEERVINSTKGMEQNLEGILKDIVSKSFDDVNIISNKDGITTPSMFKATDELLKKARDGDFEKWLDGKSGIEAEEALLDMFRSLEMVVEVSKGLNKAKPHKKDVNNIESEDTLKEIYNIVRDSEKAINESTDSFDDRKEFRYTDVESYILPMMQNKGNNVTKQILMTLNPDNPKVSEALENKLLDAGILQKIDNKLLIVDDYGKINSQSEQKATDLGRIHGILKTMGKYEITEEVSPVEVTDMQINSLKGYLGKWVDDLNQPNLEFIYPMVLKDINKIRLNNSAISPSDVDFIIQQSSLAAFGKSGLIKDKNIQGFFLREVHIPSNTPLEVRYNDILKRIKEDTGGIVQILDDGINIVKESSAAILESRLDDMYKLRDKSEENITLKGLFNAMSNTNLDGAKSRMLEYLRAYGDEAHIQVLSMLKQQGVIKRNTDNKLEIVEEKLLIEKFDEIDKTIQKRGFTPEFVAHQIDKRKEITRKYINDASDVIKNPSLSLDGFFSKYKLTHTDTDGNVEYSDYSGEESNIQRKRFEGEIFDNQGDVTQTSIKRFASRLVSGKGKFEDLDISQKDKIIQDISQIVFGSKDRISIRKASIVNGTVQIEKDQQVMQNNPVFRYLRGIGLDFTIFDNNIVRTEIDRSGNFVERTYNILSTEDIPNKARTKIMEIRDEVSKTLASKEVNLFSEFSESTVPPTDIFGTVANDIGVKKLDIYDGMESILIPSSDMGKIVDEFNRFHEEHSDKVDPNTKRAMDIIKKDFDKTNEDWKYDEEKIELAMRYLVLEVGYKSKKNELFYEILNSTEPKFVDDYIKRVKLFTTKNFIRTDVKYLRSLVQARTMLTVEGGVDKPSELLKKRLRKKSYNTVIWNDASETMSQILKDLGGDELNPEGKMSYDSVIGEAHSDVSAFDSQAYISEEAMMEFHTELGHDPYSMNPIKPVISSQGEGVTLLYGKTLFIYSPALEGFFKNNPRVDILITKSGAKAYDGGDETTIQNTRFDDLGQYKITNPNELIRSIPLDGVGLRPEKDSDLLSASESDQDYNYMDAREHKKAFDEIVDELTANLDAMESTMLDPYKINNFMKKAMYDGNIPDDAQEGSLGNLSSMLYYLKLNDSADPNDYSVNQVQKYLAKEYIDNVFSKRRAITNRIYSDVETTSDRYGGQAYLIQSAIKHQGENKKTRLLPTLYNNDNKQVLRGQIVLPDAERKSKISELIKAGKNIRIVKNTKILTSKEFIDEVLLSKSLSGESKSAIENFEEMLKQDGTLDGLHRLVQEIANEVGDRYEIGIISRRNPRTRPNDITLLGLKGFLPPKSGLAVEINSFDIVNVYEGDYDADKVDYFFAHSDYMFDYIKRNQAYFVQGIDPGELQNPSSFTFQLSASDSRKHMLSKIGSGIAYKQGIGIVAKTSRKINYVQNLASNNHLIDSDRRKEWVDEIKLNEENGEYDGPAILYKGNKGEVVTIDTKMLAFYQRYALESQYILDGNNRLNKNIGENIYEWADDFLFPIAGKSISAKEARSSDLKAIIKNGQTAEGKRVRIFQKYKYDEITKKYILTTDTDINSADKLIIREFLNQQNKLLTAFGDESYTDGASRKSSFYDKYIGSRIFRDFHKDIYKSLDRQLFYKKKNIDKADLPYLETIINADNGSFEPIQSNLNKIYDGDGGGYLDRIAVNIAKREFMESKKEYNLDTSTYLEVEQWFGELLSIDGDAKNATDEDKVFSDMPKNEMDDFATRVKRDTQEINKRIASIKRLNRKKDFINSSQYSYKWKKKKIQNIDYVIKKISEDFNDVFKRDISNIAPKDIKYKEYVSVEDSNLKRSIVHANTLHAFLKNNPKAMRYDNWFSTLGEDARDDLKDVKELNKQTYGGGTLLDEVLPYGGRSILTSSKMSEYVAKHRANLLNVFELRQKFLLEKIEEHGINFLYAYMEPTRNRDAIGVFNNRPIAIPYKESKRYSHGIQLLAGIANGSKELHTDFYKNTESQGMARHVLESLINSNEHYRKFINKDTNLKINNKANANYDLFGLMPFDESMEYRLKQNSDFDWTKEMLPGNPLSTINKSVIGFYKDYADLMPKTDDGDYERFLKQLNDLEEMSSVKDYINPIRYMDLRLRLDEDFIKLSKKDIYLYEGDEGVPQDIRDNPMYQHNKYLKFKPKQIKSTRKTISMLKKINDMQESLTLSAKQNPLRDTQYESFKSLGEFLKCP